MVVDNIHAWYYAHFYELNETVIYSNEKVFAPLFSFPIPIRLDILTKVKKIYLESKETITVFAKENGHYNRTSESLHIHRNTLAYRLNRIKEVTTLDPSKWYELGLLMYYFSYCYVQLMEESQGQVEKEAKRSEE